MGLSWMPLLPQNVMQKADEELARAEKKTDPEADDATDSETEPLANSNDPRLPSFKIDLNIVEQSCQRYVLFCNSMESMSRKVFFAESIITLLVFIMGSLRCNPILLRLVIGAKSIRNSQPVVRFAYQMATYFRAPLSQNEWMHIPTLTYHILCGLNVALLTFDICYSVYLWVKVRKEVLFLHFKAERIASLQIRHILISMVVAPMVSWSQTRYTIFSRFYGESRYFVSNILTTTLKGYRRLKVDFETSVQKKDYLEEYKRKLKEQEAASKSKTSQNNSTVEEESPETDKNKDKNKDKDKDKDNEKNNSNEGEKKVDGKAKQDLIDEEKAFKEFETSYLNDAAIFWDIELEKCKITEMTDMEDVLELTVPSYCLLHITLYLMFAGLKYLYIYCGIFSLLLLLIFKFRFSKNIGIITPVLIPLLLVAFEFVAFMFVAMLASLYMQPITAVVSIGLCVLLIFSFFWKDTSASAQLCGGVLDDVMQISGNNRGSLNNTINMGNGTGNGSHVMKTD